ncbi:MAG: hypothetical protein NZM26_03060 [Patescibacteria group bacterium]|nr:hypothetical protein [Patescibacteria group bacterium]
MLLVTRIGQKTQKLVALVNKNISQENVKVELASLFDLSFVIDTGKLIVKIGVTDIKDFDLVYIRRAGTTSTILANTLGIYLKHEGVAFFDSVFGEYSAKGNKLRSLVQLALNNIPVPKTIYFANSENYPDYQYLVNELHSPFIAKNIEMQRGKGIYLIKSNSDYEFLLQGKKKLGKAKFFYQRFVDKNHEYRVIVMGNEATIWYEKFPSNKNEFRYNSALGAKEIYYDLKNIPKELKEIAIKASRCLKQEISGVDIVQDKNTNLFYVLEANRSPGFELDENLSPEVKTFSDFLKRSVCGDNQLKI